MIELNPAFKETWETWGVVQQVGFVALFAILVLTMVMILIYIWNDIDKQMERRHEALEQILRKLEMNGKMIKTLKTEINDEYDSDNEAYIKWLYDIYRLTFVGGKNSKQKIRSKVSQEIDRVKNNE